MKIYLLLNQPYPNGYALTKRFHLYAKGLVNNGHYSKIIIPQPIKGNEKLLNISTSGIFDDVPFEYTCNDTRRGKSFLMRRYQDFIGTYKVGLICIKERPDIVITSSFSLCFYLYLKFISIITSFKFIREKNEVDYMNEDFISHSKKIRIKYLYSVFNGFVVINNQLLNYMKFDLKIRKIYIVVPILVEDFKRKKKLPIQKTIVYTGTYLERKDGILTILNAFAEIKHKYPDYKLLLTGSPQRSKDYVEIMNTIAFKELESQVNFTGYLSENALRDVLMSANMLILAKPENRQNYYNFPTKVGEYLMSGRPVIATKVGVIGEILEDKKNVIFSEYEIHNIAEKMEFVIQNPEMVDKIGSSGREFALENFDYLKHTKKMVDYFQSLN